MVERVHPTGLAAITIGFTVALGTITTVIVSFRLWFRYWLRTTRIETKAWGVDDWLCGFGLLAFIAACAFTIAASYYGLGTHDSLLTPEQKSLSLEFIFFFQLCEAAFTILIKSSIAIFLLRIAIQRRYRYPLWFVIIATIVGCVVPGVVVITLCRPLSAQWDPSAGTCGDYSIIISLSYAVSVITVVTDWVCAIIPCILIRSLNITTDQKIPLMITLSLGILASAASIGRMPYLQYYDTAREDRIWGSANILLWCVVEGALAFIAGSLAPIRKAPALLIRGEKAKSSHGTQSNIELENQSRSRSRNTKLSRQVIEPTAYDGDSQHSLLDDQKACKVQVNPV
ncbi:hypothetical protein F4809DRAFT_585837 [Biscogniauxia mediterranea]|nr:hypothetical protein F4809DRAFT_585837 [Biscogniauxia mediterranea]